MLSKRSRFGALSSQPGCQMLVPNTPWPLPVHAASHRSCKLASQCARRELDGCKSWDLSLVWWWVGAVFQCLDLYGTLAISASIFTICRMIKYGDLCWPHIISIQGSLTSNCCASRGSSLSFGEPVAKLSASLSLSTYSTILPCFNKICLLFTFYCSSLQSFHRV